MSKDLHFYRGKGRRDLKAQWWVQEQLCQHSSKWDEEARLSLHVAQVLHSGTRHPLKSHVEKRSHRVSHQVLAKLLSEPQFTHLSSVSVTR